LLTREGRYDDAIGACDEILKATPDQRDALTQKIATLHAAGRLDDADKAIEAGRSKYPRDPSIFAEIGSVRFDQKRYDEALEALVQAGSEEYREWISEYSDPEEAAPLLATLISRFPKSTEFLNLRAAVFENDDRYTESAGAYDATLAVDANDKDALRGKARVLRKAGEFNAADAALAAAQAKFPDDSDILAERGYLLFAQKRYDQGIEAFLSAGDEAQLREAIGTIAPADKAIAIEAALSRLPKSVAVLNARADFYARQNRHDFAAATFERALAIAPHNRAAILGKAKALRAAGRLDEAATAVAAALEELPGDPDLLRDRAALHLAREEYDLAAASWLALSDDGALPSEAEALRKKRQFAECRRLLEAGLKQRPNNSRLLTQLGVLDYEQHRYEAALEAFVKAVAADPGTDFVLRNKCVTLRILRRFPEAEEAVEHALRQLPNSQSLLIERGWLHYAQARYSEAVAAFDRAIAAGDWSWERTDAYVAKIEALRAQCPEIGDQPLAEAIEEALQRQPDDGRLIFERARLYHRQGDLARAETEFAKAIEATSPFFLDAYFQRAEVLALLGRRDDALQLLRQLQEAQPDNLSVRAKLGWYYRSQKDLTNAEEQFQIVLRNDPSDINAINGMGALHFDREQYAAADAEFRKALSFEPNEAYSHNNLAVSLVKQSKPSRSDGWIEVRGPLSVLKIRKFARRDDRSDAPLLDEAEKHYRVALELSPNYPSAFSGLAEIALKRGRLMDAEGLFKKSVALDPWANGDDLGALYIRMGRYEEAEKILKEFCSRNPAAVQARLELGDLYLQTGRAKQAVAICREARAIEPDRSEPARALAITLMQTGEYAEATKVLREALRTVDESKRWQLHLTYCQLLTELGDKSEDQDLYEEARREAATAITLRPDDPMPYFYAGIVRYKLENYHGALTAFRMCLDRDPDHLEAEQNARRMKSLIQRDRAQTHGGLVVGSILGGVCLLLLIAMWMLYFRSEKVTSTMIATMSPTLSGLVFVGFLLPWLSRLKLPGLEAELSKPREKLAPGPKIPLGFGRPAIGAGPR
jgi:tetratricopeptide (TPR) repeat protein